MSLNDEIRFPIGKEKDQEGYKSDFNESLKSSLIEDIRILPISLEYAIQNLDAAQLATPYREGGWTARQVIHHIPESHMNAYIRFKLALTETDPVVKPYDEAAWARLNDVHATPVETSVSLLDTDVNVILGLLLLCRLGGSVLL